MMDGLPDQQWSNEPDDNHTLPIAMAEKVEQLGIDPDEVVRRALGKRPEIRFSLIQHGSVLASRTPWQISDIHQNEGCISGFKMTARKHFRRPPSVGG